MNNWNFSSMMQDTLKKEILDKSKGYIRVEAQLLLKERKNPPPAEFHFITKIDSEPKLVGVVHIIKE